MPTWRWIFLVSDCAFRPERHRLALRPFEDHGVEGGAAVGRQLRQEALREAGLRRRQGHGLRGVVERQRGRIAAVREQVDLADRIHFDSARRFGVGPAPISGEDNRRIDDERSRAVVGAELEPDLALPGVEDAIAAGDRLADAVPLLIDDRLLQPHVSAVHPQREFAVGLERDADRRRRMPGESSSGRVRGATRKSNSRCRSLP